MSQLLPDGIRHLRDVPYPLHRAIRAALMFLSFEELQPDDRPPRSMWLNADALRQWFDDVKRRQTERMEGRDIEDPKQNAALDMLIVGDR